MLTFAELKLVPTSELLKAASERISALEEDKFEGYLLRPIVHQSDAYDLCRRFESLLLYARLWAKDPSCQGFLREGIEDLADVDLDSGGPDHLWDDLPEGGQLCDLSRQYVTLQHRYNELQRLYRTRLEVTRTALIKAGVVKAPETTDSSLQSAAR